MKNYKFMPNVEAKFMSQIYQSNLLAKFYEPNLWAKFDFQWLGSTSNSMLSHPKKATLVETLRAEQELADSKQLCNEQDCWPVG